MTDHSVRNGRLLVVAAALLWSTSGLFVKSPLLVAIPEADRGPILACYRALFAGLCLAAFVRPRDIRWRPMLIPMVLSFTAMNLLFVSAMTRTTAAAAIFLQYTSTVWAFVFSVLFLGERADRGNLTCVICAVVGIVWILSAQGEGQSWVGNLYGLGSGVAFAGVVLSLRHLRGESSAWLIALNHLFACVVLLPYVLLVPTSLDAGQWMLVAVFGILQMGIPYVLFARGVRYVSAQEAALIPIIEPVLNPIWVLIIWGEPIALATWIGGSFIVGGLLIRYTIFNPKRHIAGEPA